MYSNDQMDNNQQIKEASQPILKFSIVMLVGNHELVLEPPLLEDK